MATQTYDFHAIVQRWDRRYRLQQILKWLPRVIAPFLLLGLILALYSRFRLGVSDQTVLSLTGVGLLAGITLLSAIVMLWRRSILDNAQRFDRDFGLQERISTAIELLEGRIRSTDDLIEHQLEDAYHHANAIPVREHLPFKPDRREWIAVALLALSLALLLAFTGPVLAGNPSEQAQEAAIAEAEEDLKDIIEDVTADPTLTEEQRQQLLEELQSDLETLQDENITPEEAFATLSDAQARLQEEADALQQESQVQQEALSEAGSALNQGLGQPANANPSAASAAIDQMQQNLESAEMTQAEMDEYADALEQAAEAIEQTNPALAEALRDAAEALRQGDTAAAQEALERAQELAQEAGEGAEQTAQSGEQLGEAAQQAGQAADQIAQAGQQGQPGQSGQPGSPQSGQTGQQGQSGQTGEQGNGSQGQQGGQSGQGNQTSPNGNPANNAGQNSSGQGAGQSGSQSGAGASGAGDGEGDPRGDTRGGGERDPNETSGNNNPDGTGEREYEEIYAPEFIGGDGSTDIQLNADPSGAPLQEGNFSENPSGTSVIPYNEVFGEYADSANRALDQDYIPLGMRDVIRDYFSSLDPGR